MDRIEKCFLSDSNQRPIDLQSSALPSELRKLSRIGRKRKERRKEREREIEKKKERKKRKMRELE